MASDPQVMPSLRMLWVDRVVQIAFQRCDRRTRGAGDLDGRRADSGGLRRRVLGARTPTFASGTARLANAPHCRPLTGPHGWGFSRGPSARCAGPLSIVGSASIRWRSPGSASRRLVDPSSRPASRQSKVPLPWSTVSTDRAEQLWSSTLATAADKNYLLLVCDSLEAIGSLHSEGRLPIRLLLSLPLPHAFGTRPPIDFGSTSSGGWSTRAWATIGPIEGTCVCPKRPSLARGRRHCALPELSHERSGLVASPVTGCTWHQVRA